MITDFFTKTLQEGLIREFRAIILTCKHIDKLNEINGKSSSKNLVRKGILKKIVTMSEGHMSSIDKEKSTVTRENIIKGKKKQLNEMKVDLIQLNYS